MQLLKLKKNQSDGVLSLLSLKRVTQISYSKSYTKNQMEKKLRKKNQKERKVYLSITILNSQKSKSMLKSRLKTQLVLIKIVVLQACKMLSERIQAMMMEKREMTEIFSFRCKRQMTSLKNRNHQSRNIKITCRGTRQNSVFTQMIQLSIIQWQIKKFNHSCHLSRHLSILINKYKQKKVRQKT